MLAGIIFVSQTTGVILVQASLFGREKLVYREAKSVEKLTGVVFGRNSRTFIIGNTEVNYRNDELNFSYQSYDCKQTKGNEHLANILAAYEVFFKYRTDALGNGVYICVTTTAATVFLRLYDSCTKRYGVNHFCVCQRVII